MLLYPPQSLEKRPTLPRYGWTVPSRGGALMW
jgi:hypothetical protein